MSIAIMIEKGKRKKKQDGSSDDDTDPLHFQVKMINLPSKEEEKDFRIRQTFALL